MQALLSRSRGRNASTLKPPYPFRPLAYKLTNGRLPIDLAPMFPYLVLIVLMNLVSRCMMWVY